MATRLPGGLRRAGGWRDTSVAVPAGRWRDVLTGTEHSSAGGSPDGTGTGHPRQQITLADLTSQLPVALLVPADDAASPGRELPA